MSYLKVWIHLVFSTKNREPFLTKSIRGIVQDHVRENCKVKDIYLKEIGGYHDHLHCLISLGKTQTIAEVSQLIKGESSFWINKNKLIPYKFSWQDDYFAVSVSLSQLGKVVNYIKNQENHHKANPFTKEIDEFVNKYGFEVIRK